MTTRAAISQADLKRMATVAKAEGVSIEIEINGRKIRVSPDIPTSHKPAQVDQPQDITL